MVENYTSNTYSVDQLSLNKYAELSGGTGKIHTNPDYVKGTVFKRTLVHGIYLLTLVEKELNEFNKDDHNKEFIDYQVKSTFINPVFADEEFTIQLTRGNNQYIDFKVMKSDGCKAIIGHFSTNYS
ncbi:MaoC/PaaZ C-terminal domain-containing protein [Pseudalkalibacillus sp. A8]|uniref:MaoC/PaaZ C-terminal domain-containing protein n=1 Tax=Pseudalkalibacillus sp. A8 TaxID=3382641 RepID=UPI0038B5FCD5